MRRHHQLIASLILLLSTFVAPGRAFAQSGAPSRPTHELAREETRIRDAAQDLDSLRPTNARQTGSVRPTERRRDSLKNGALIGALAGAAAMGTFAALICNAQQEPEGPSCLPDTLRIAGLGAAIGLGGGLVIDAALTKQAGASLSVGVRF